MTLAELCNAINRIGGRLVRQGDGRIVEAPAGTVTPEIEAALATHQGELLALLPPPTAKPERYPNAEEIIRAAWAKGGKITKDDDGICKLDLPAPDPELEEAFAKQYDEVRKNVQTDKEFWAEMERVHMMGMGV